MLTNLEKTPWPWFGGKADAAPIVWEALGDVAHYVEPFAGSLAVLLRRPHPCNRVYYSETVNDLDGLLVNAWRSMRMAPDAMADAASWPVTEADLHARHLALVRWREEQNLERLMSDPLWHDPVMAGWWAWGQSAWIGSGWCRGDGAWIVGADGRIRKQPKGTREPGIERKRPHLSDDGRGVNHAGTREPGVGTEPEYHPMTMPELTRWFRFLSARLRHVRIINGDWQRACTNGAIKSLAVRSGKGVAGVFLDPPYIATGNRTSDLYTHDEGDTAAMDVQRWCIDRTGDDAIRVVLAGFEGEHDILHERHGWRCVPWYRTGFLKGGMGNVGGSGNDQQARERLWLSPSCLLPVSERSQVGLFGGAR